MKTLLLTLKKAPFEVMRTGEKKLEYRTPSKWIISRLVNKDGSPKEYDFILFINGYSKKAPSFMCRYRGFVIWKGEPIPTQFSSGLDVSAYVKIGMVVIKLGEIVQYGF